jgi:eukaryotic-like serine/threonine-protein kinase
VSASTPPSEDRPGAANADATETGAAADAGGPGGPGAPGTRPRDPRKRALLFLVGGLLVALIIVAVVLIVAKPKQKLVPAVVGQDLTAAQSILDDDGFDVAVRRVTNVAARDRVLGQDPDSGNKADDGSTVTLTVSNGPGQGTVPDVASLSEPKAETALREAGFKARVKQQFSSAVTQGDAIRTTPAAGTRLQRLSSVVLVVSNGPQTVSVPDVVGNTESAAKAGVDQAGLQIEIVQQRSNQSPGDVLSQSPAAGTTVVIGSVVRVVVDKAPKPVQVPDVDGEQQDDAVSALSSLGLAVFFSNKTVSDPSQDGVVLSQRPTAGTEVAPGTRVVLQIGQYSSGPTPPTPPTATTAATTSTTQTTSTSP